ncbi:MAG: hypothetical protein AAGG07_07975 [Planctomycetota bacterium]
MKTVMTAAMAALVAGTAAADTLTFDSRSDFRTAAGGPLAGFESFEAESNGLILAGQSHTTANGLTFMPMGNRFASAASLDFSLLGTHATHGERYARIVAGDLLFELPEAANAIGFDITDFPELRGSRMTFSNNAGDSVEIEFDSRGSGNSEFFGLINTQFSFNRILLSNSRAVDAYGIDGIEFGNLLTDPIIPAPTAAVMGLAGLAGVGIRRRR